MLYGSASQKGIYQKFNFEKHAYQNHLWISTDMQCKTYLNMRKTLGFLTEIEFFIKISVACTLLQQLFYLFLKDIQIPFEFQVLLYYMVGSVSFYGIGFLIEKWLKKNKIWRDKRNIRVVKVKEQDFPNFTPKGIALGELKSLIAAFIILYLAPEVHRGNSLSLNFIWFLMRIVVADFCFYISHYILHKYFLKIHLKHHEFRDSSSFVASHKSLSEYTITTITDLLPIFIFGCDLSQICAWTIVGNFYNLEGHSSLSIFFVSSDFHDRHHTCFKGNYGIQGFWDRIFGTLAKNTRKQGILFPTNYLQ